MTTAAIADPRPALFTFTNEPFLDFTSLHTRHAMEQALADVKSKLGHEYDLVIGGRRLQTCGKIVSSNPARPSEVVGIHQMAVAEHVELAMSAAQEAVPPLPSSTFTVTV